MEFKMSGGIGFEAFDAVDPGGNFVGIEEYFPTIFSACKTMAAIQIASFGGFDVKHQIIL